MINYYEWFESLKNYIIYFNIMTPGNGTQWSIQINKGKMLYGFSFLECLQNLYLYFEENPNELNYFKDPDNE